jgi:hypothetical protein
MIIGLLDAWPPFRAFNYAFMLSWHSLAVGSETREKFETGRIDLFMAIYLPYCDKFVTAEKNGEPEKCLREIAAIAGLETDILSYDRFRESFD